MSADVLKNEEISNFQQKPSVLWVIGLVTCMSASGASSGLLFSLSGPTLLYLAENVQATVVEVSAMFTGRSGGMFVGFVCFGITMNRFGSLQPLKAIGFLFMFVGILTVIIPWIKDLAGLIVVSVIIGLFTGFGDAGMQSLYLKHWGEEHSRPFIQTYHFCTGLGGLIAPLLANPFLKMADQQGYLENSCLVRDSDVAVTTSAYDAMNLTSAPSQPTEFNPVSWTYIISGCLTFVSALIMFVLALVHVEDHVQTARKTITEQREEEPFKNVYCLLLTIVLFFFMISGGVNVYQSYIYSVALCSDLLFSVSDALFLNTVFWFGYSSSTFLGIICAKFLLPSTMIALCLIIVTISIILVSVLGHSIAALLWTGTFFSGFCLSSLFPTGVSWTSRVTNVSKTYILVFGLGNTLGQMTMLPLAGALFEIDPYNVIYLVCGLIVGLDVTFICMLWIEKNHPASPELSKTKQKEVSPPKKMAPKQHFNYY